MTYRSWASSAANRASMQGNRSRDTVPEMAIRKLVHRSGLRYRVSVRPIPTLRRTADLVFPRARVAVFVDGCFWHGCPYHFRLPRTNTEYWRAKISRNQDRDVEVDRTLSDRGWLVVRVWEHEPPEEAASRIKMAVDSRLAEGRPRRASRVEVAAPEVAAPST